MIKIEHPNLDSIATFYFNKIEKECVGKSLFLKLVLEVIFNGRPHSDLRNSKLNGNTKKSLLNFLLLPGNQIKNQTSYSNVLRANCKPWVKTQRRILEKITDYYSDANNLKDTILVKAEDSYHKDLDLKKKFGITTGNAAKTYLFVNKILDYDNFDKYAYWMSSEIGVNTCPYCNRSFIHTVLSKTGAKIIRPTFDHFYPQSKHPFLALSFYNLIPSCYNCNSSLKTATTITPLTHLHPYIEGFDNDANFFIKITANKPNKSDPENYSISLLSTMAAQDPRKRKIFGNSVNEGNVNLFKLNDIYMAHRDVVGELIVKCDKYSSGYTDSLYKFFGLLKSNKTEFYQFYFGNYYNQNDFNRRPLAKMTKDIVSSELPWFI